MLKRNKNKQLLSHLKDIRRALQFLSTQMSYLVMRNYFEEFEEGNAEIPENSKNLHKEIKTKSKGYIG
jgi:hypothetical protein